MQLKELAMKVSFSFTPGVRKTFSQLDNWQQKAHPYTCTLGYQGRKISVDYFMGSALTGPPKCLEVLDCLLSDSQVSEGSFENFCSELGYDKTALKVYRSCLAIRKKLERLLGQDFQAFMKAEKD